MSRSPRKLKFQQQVQGSSVDLDAVMADLEDKENRQPDVNAQQSPRRVNAAATSNLNVPGSKSKSKSKQPRDSKVRFNEERASLRSSQRQAAADGGEGDESFESFQQMVGQEIEGEAQYHQESERPSHAVEAEDSVLVEFEKAGKRISRAQRQIHGAQEKLAKYAEALIDQTFKGEDMQGFLNMPIDQFMRLSAKPEPVLRLEPIQDDGTEEIRELNEYVGEILSFQNPVEQQEHSVQCSIPMSPGPQFKAQAMRMAADLEVARERRAAAEAQQVQQHRQLHDALGELQQSRAEQEAEQIKAKQLLQEKEQQEALKQAQESAMQQARQELSGLKKVQRADESKIKKLQKSNKQLEEEQQEQKAELLRKQADLDAERRLREAIEQEKIDLQEKLENHEKERNQRHHEAAVTKEQADEVAMEEEKEAAQPKGRSARTPRANPAASATSQRTRKNAKPAASPVRGVDLSASPNKAEEDAEQPSSGNSGKGGRAKSQAKEVHFHEDVIAQSILKKGADLTHQDEEDDQPESNRSQKSGSDERKTKKPTKSKKAAKAKKPAAGGRSARGKKQVTIAEEPQVTYLNVPTALDESDESEEEPVEEIKPVKAKKTATTKTRGRSTSTNKSQKSKSAKSEASDVEMEIEKVLAPEPKKVEEKKKPTTRATRAASGKRRGK